MYDDVVKSDIHSTDAGSYTAMCFGAMRLLGFSYAPPARQPGRQPQRIYR
jgi:hypothetical protein